VSHHKRVGGENRGRNERGSINGKEGVDSRELAADFFFLNVEEAGNMLNHLLVGECQFVTGRTVRRRGSDDVGGIACAVHGRGGTRRDEDGGR